SQAAAATAATVSGAVINHAAPMPPAGGGGKDAAGSGRQEQPSGQSKAATKPGPRLPSLSANDGGMGAGGATQLAGGADELAGRPVAAALIAGGEPAAPDGGKLPAANASGTGTAANTAAIAAPGAGAGTAAVQAAAPGGSVASHLAAQLTAAAAPPTEAPQAGNANKLTLTLHNDTLGAVAVQATLRPQGLEAAIQAARADTHAAMQQGLPLLQQTLTDHNIRLVNLTVSRGPASNSSAASSSGQGGARQAFAQTGGGGGQNQTGGGGGALAQTVAGTAEGAPADRGPASGLARPGGAPAVAPGRLSIRV
ncbi:MAG: flagellar hook-length control protein FliK, partial [Terriglobales bacterium]